MKNTEPKKKMTLMGQLLKKVAEVRWKAKADAAEALWKKHQLTNPSQREAYRMIQESSVNRAGEEITTTKLWKLIDKSVTTLGSEISVTVREGIEQGDEYSNRAAPTNDNRSPI